MRVKASKIGLPILKIIQCMVELKTLTEEDRLISLRTLERLG